MKRIARLFIVAALMVSIGLPWAALQSVAWIGMAVTYTVEKGSVVEGLSDTFDGAHPCALCHAVSDGQEKEKKQEQDQGGSPKKKLEMLPLNPPSLWRPKLPPQEYSWLDFRCDRRAATPLLPPPRWA
ncbi:hypothetical protein [Prosthecobacter algae]